MRSRHIIIQHILSCSRPVHSERWALTFKSRNQHTIYPLCLFCLDFGQNCNEPKRRNLSFIYFSVVIAPLTLVSSWGHEFLAPTDHVGAVIWSFQCLCRRAIKIVPNIATVSMTTRAPFGLDLFLQGIWGDFNNTCIDFNPAWSIYVGHFSPEWQQFILFPLMSVDISERLKSLSQTGFVSLCPGASLHLSQHLELQTAF